MQKGNLRKLPIQRKEGVTEERKGMGAEVLPNWQKKWCNFLEKKTPPRSWLNKTSNSYFLGGSLKRGGKGRKARHANICSKR